MKRLAVPLVIAALVVVGAGDGRALAAEGAHAIRPASEGFDLTPVAVPVVVDGRVLNYIFITVRLMPTPSANVPALRDKEPFFRDALVRAAHRTPFTKSDDYNRIDETLVSAAVMAVSASIAGPGQIRAATVSKQQPKNTVRSPKPQPPKRPAG